MTDSKNSTKSGRLKEVLGSYDPRKSVDAIDAERVKYWLGLGAKATGTVHNLLITNKVTEGKKMNVLPRKKPVAKAKTDEVSSPDSAPAESREAVVESTEAPAETDKPAA